MDSKLYIAPPPPNENEQETETFGAIPELALPSIATEQQAPVAATQTQEKPARGKRAEVRAAAALFVCLLGLMTIAGGAVMLMFFV